MEKKDSEKKPIPWEVGDPKVPVIRSGHFENKKENNIKELEESLKEYDSAIKRALGNNDETAAEKILSKRIEKESQRYWQRF